MTADTDWLVRQLPVGMTDDDFLLRFVRMFQEIAHQFLHTIDEIPHLFDATVAPPEVIRMLGQWIGVDFIDADLPVDVQRRMLIEMGELLRWRGTTQGVLRLVELMTDGPVTIEDTGGVFAEGDYDEDDLPVSLGHTRITVEQVGWAQETRHLVEIVRTELPASISFELVVGGETVWPAADAPPVVDVLEEAG